MNNAIQIVANLISAQRAGEKVVKKDFAAKYDISPRTLSRYEAKYSDQAIASIEGTKKTKVAKGGTTVSKKFNLNEQLEKIAKQDGSAHLIETEGVSKKDIAAQIFVNMQGAKRKEVIAAFMKHADLTKAGAGTYYYNIKKELSK